MTLNELRARAASHYGYDSADISELEPALTDYLNEGYMQLALERYRPWRDLCVSACDMSDGFPGGKAIPYALLCDRPLEVLLVYSEGKLVEAYKDDMAQAVQLPHFSCSGGLVTCRIRYTYKPLNLVCGEDKPKLPDHLHYALSDYATWRLFLCGDAQHQGRGTPFRMNYDHVRTRLTPLRAEELGYDVFKNLYN